MSDYVRPAAYRHLTGAVDLLIRAATLIGGTPARTGSWLTTVEWQAVLAGSDTCDFAAKARTGAAFMVSKPRR
jgi:hypothetical protein